MQHLLITAKDEMIAHGERLMHRNSVNRVLQRRPMGDTPGEVRHLELRLFNLRQPAIHLDRTVMVPVGDPLNSDEQDQVAFAERNLVSALLKRVLVEHVSPDAQEAIDAARKHTDLVGRSLQECYRMMYIRRHHFITPSEVGAFVADFSTFALDHIHDMVPYRPPGAGMSYANR